MPQPQPLNLTAAIRQRVEPFIDYRYLSTYREQRIVGSGFGTKLSTTPYYLNFESETLGAVGATVGSLVVSINTGTSIINTDSNSGSKCLQQDFSIETFPKIYKALAGTGKTVYMSCAVKFSGTTLDSAGVWKFGRIGAGVAYSGVGHAGASYTSTGITDRPSSVSGEIVNSDGIVAWSEQNVAADGAINTLITPGSWHFYELEFYGGTTDVSDAYFSERWSNKDTTLWVNAPFFTTANSLPLDWALTPINGLDGGHPITFLMDDVYIDESRCRIVMTNNATYDSSTKFAIQPIVSWSDTEILYTARRQNFAVNDTAYIHVFNESGTLVYSSEAFSVVEDV